MCFNQPLFIFGQGEVYLRELSPTAVREAVLVTPAGTPPRDADIGNHRAASVPRQDFSPLRGPAQLENSDIHKIIKVGNIFRNYLPVRVKACLAFM